jgi:hypothetical protein
MSNLKTFNRAKLRKLVEAGKVVKIESYHFDDMTGENRSTKPMPVAMKPADWKDREDGVCYLTEFDFKAKSGRAWYTEGSDLITLSVHGNSNYTLRILP